MAMVLVLVLVMAMDFVLDWHYGNVKNNSEAKSRSFPTLQHDVFIEASTAIKEADELLGAKG